MPKTPQQLIAERLGGPYSQFDPKKDPYLKSNPIQPLRPMDYGQYGKGYVSGWAGLPGGLLEAARPFQVIQPRNNPLPTEQDVGRKLGADVQSKDFKLGTIGMPGVDDFLIKTLMALKHAPEGLIAAQGLFHGTLHKFDKFDLKAIGTGEGAQAYGHGLYFAESPGVAKSYQSTLSGGRQEVLNAIDVITGDVPLESMKVPLNTQKAIDTIKADPDLFAEIQSLAPNDIGIRPFKTAGGKTKGELVESLQDKLELGHLYEVDIPDETIGKMLDWDAPLSEQPESVRKALNSIGINDEAFADSLIGDLARKRRGGVHGRDIYLKAHSMFRTKVEASKALNEAGIPGIRFFDGSSRKTGRAWQEGLPEGWSYYKGKTGVGIKDDKGLIQTSDFKSQKDAHQHLFGLKPTRNIVVFNPDDITQVKRDGKLVFKNLNDRVQAALKKVDNSELSDEIEFLGDTQLEGGENTTVNWYQALNDAEETAEYNGDKKLLKAARQVQIELGVYAPVSEAELLRIQTTGGKKYAFQMGGTKYKFVAHPK